MINTADLSALDFRIPSFFPRMGPDYVSDPRQRIARMEQESVAAFDQFLNAAMDVVNETNMRLIESDIAQVNFATGQCNDMLNVVLAQDRAGSALNFTVQVSNRIIEAYREIMRMQV